MVSTDAKRGYRTAVKAAESANRAVAGGDYLDRYVNDIARVISLNDPMGALRDAWEMGKDIKDPYRFRERQINGKFNGEKYSSDPQRRRQQQIRDGTYVDPEYLKFQQRQLDERTVNGRVLESVKEAEAIRGYLERKQSSSTRTPRASSKYKRSKGYFKGRRKQSKPISSGAGSRYIKSYGKYPRAKRRRGGDRRI